MGTPEFCRVCGSLYKRFVCRACDGEGHILSEPVAREDDRFETECPDCGGSGDFEACPVEMIAGRHPIARRA